HRFTNQADDPDIAPVRNLRTWWQRMLFSRVIYNALYFMHTLRLAQGKPVRFKYKMSFPHEYQVLLARLNFLFSTLWIGLYVAICFYDIRAGIYGIALPLAVGTLIGACQIYIDHAGLDDRFFATAWSRTSPLMTALFFG